MSFISAFLQQTVYLGMPDDSLQKNEGTVTAAANFSPNGDAAILDKAIKAKGVDENTIIEILVKRTNEQRQQIKEAYQQASGKKPLLSLSQPGSTIEHRRKRFQALSHRPNCDCAYGRTGSQHLQYHQNCSSICSRAAKYPLRLPSRSLTPSLAPSHSTSNPSCYLRSQQLQPVTPSDSVVFSHHPDMEHCINFIFTHKRETNRWRRNAKETQSAPYQPPSLFCLSPSPGLLNENTLQGADLEKILGMECAGKHNTRALPGDPAPNQRERHCLFSSSQAGRTEGVCEQLIDSDARALYEAGEGRKGKDSSVFIDILLSRSASHLRKVFERYSKYSKVDVAKAIDLEMKGDIESCLTAVVKCAGSRPAFFAEKLYLAMKGKGTRKPILTRIMVSRSEIDMKRIKDEYKKNYGKTLYQDILDDTKGDYEKILLALCGGEN
ncbi:annexin A1a [Morone saxatilis]|uniref:annexin A1a n=1 Tax=Morone saxatilis TaxID=34816 RepID=UPI0015E25845|nr:annexin A1a [Morone saxatilis]